jgi:hypothetical protein
MKKDLKKGRSMLLPIQLTDKHGRLMPSSIQGFADELSVENSNRAAVSASVVYDN